MSTIVIQFDTADGPAAGIAAISDAVAELGALNVRAEDDEIALTLTAAVEGIGRAVDALRIECAAELGERSRVSLGAASLSAKKGCGSPAELLTRVTRISASAARTRLKLGGETRSQLSLSGVEFPARFPLVAAALEAGTLGIDSAQAILAGLVPIIDHAAIDEIAAAEAELVASATGIGPDTAVPCPADEIRVQAQVWKSVLDPDGLEPTEERMMQRRGFSLPRERGGLLHGTYALMPEVGASSSGCSMPASRRSPRRHSFAMRSLPSRTSKPTPARPSSCATMWWPQWSIPSGAAVRDPRLEGRRQPFW